VQDDGLPAKMNGGAKDHGHNAAKLRCQGIGEYAEAIATAPNTFVLLVVVLTRLPGVIIMIVTVRDRLLDRNQTERSMGVAADERQRE
jgi:hypothetical protein